MTAVDLANTVSRFKTAIRREQELIRTNGLGAIDQFKIGSEYKCGGREFLITRHRIVHTTPWATVIVYGRPRANPREKQ